METEDKFPYDEVPEHLRAFAKRFVQYAKIDTQSCDESETTPSTMKQHVLADLLVKQLKEMGVEDVVKTDKCVVLGTIKPVGFDIKEKVPTVCFISHVDTAQECSDEGVNPQLVKNYKPGDDLTYTNAAGEKIILTHYSSCKSELDLCAGHTIITTDGTTLLGGDDKAGITAIMEAIKEMIADNETRRCRIRVCFTPDEEIGRGADNLTKELLDADYALTVDGGFLGEYNKETFNASNVSITFKGHAVHPGSAYGVMGSSSRVMASFVNSIPETLECYSTKDREGYIHVIEMNGDTESSTVKLILRSFNKSDLDDYEQMLHKLAKEAIDIHYKHLSSYGLCSKDVNDVFSYTMNAKRLYNNLWDGLKEIPNAVRFTDDIVVKSMEDAGAKPVCVPIRGGTDGIAITELGIPCPNMFTGASNMHSISEFVSLDTMERSKQTIVNICRNVLSLM